MSYQLAWYNPNLQAIIAFCKIYPCSFISELDYILQITSSAKCGEQDLNLRLNPFGTGTSFLRFEPSSATAASHNFILLNILFLYYTP